MCLRPGPPRATLRSGCTGSGRSEQPTEPGPSWEAQGCSPWTHEGGFWGLRPAVPFLLAEAPHVRGPKLPPGVPRQQVSHQSREEPHLHHPPPANSETSEAPRPGPRPLLSPPLPAAQSLGQHLGTHVHVLSGPAQGPSLPSTIFCGPWRKEQPHPKLCPRPSLPRALPRHPVPSRPVPSQGLSLFRPPLARSRTATAVGTMQPVDTAPAELDSAWSPRLPVAHQPPRCSMKSDHTCPDTRQLPGRSRCEGGQGPRLGPVSEAACGQLGCEPETGVRPSPTWMPTADSGFGGVGSASVSPEDKSPPARCVLTPPPPIPHRHLRGHQSGPGPDCPGKGLLGRGQWVRGHRCPRGQLPEALPRSGSDPTPGPEASASEPPAVLAPGPARF